MRAKQICAGSIRGKTLAYMCPLLAALGAIQPRISREDGTRALVMVGGDVQAKSS
jgi:hypothetical protein